MVAAPKQRVVLAALLLHRGRAVTADELAAAVWGPVPPASAQVTLRNYVRRLRLALGGAGLPGIATRPGQGYQLDVPDGDVDAMVFETLVRQASAAADRGLWDEAGGGLRAALALWRGEPLADIPSDVLIARERPRLAELHATAVQLRVEADVRTGRAGAVIGELRQLTAADPLRERLHALLMLALYREGRQAEALEAYRRARDLVVSELGVEPGPELRRLHHQMLTADPALTAEARPRSGPAPGAGAGSAGAGSAGPDGPAGPGRAGPEAPVVPRQLPFAVRSFAGRQAELGALSGLLAETAGGQSAGAVVISAIGGTAGVGKTALAVHWAHRVASEFPDGQLYVNLRGFDPSNAPAEPAEVIRGFLDALAVPANQVPASPASQAGLYRSLLAGRRMLIVLDNARDAAQVQPLLPGAPRCLAVITSRRQLTALAATSGAQLLSLDVLTEPEAEEFLTARIGAARAAAEPAVVRDLAGLCARLPLALSIVAAQAAARPGSPLSALAAELRQAGNRLDELETGEATASVRSAISWSYRQLAPASARMFRLLGVHPGPDITPAAAACLAGVSLPQARQELAELTRSHLITEPVPGRLAFHDLLRAYAAELASREPRAGRQEAVRRVLDYYLLTSHAAALLLNPPREAIALPRPAPGVTPEKLDGSPAAMAWFGAEHRVLIAAADLAARTGLDACVWQLAWALDNFLDWRGRWPEWAALQRAGLDAATRAGDVAAQAMARRLVAHTCARVGDYEQTLDHLTQCLALYRQLGNQVGQGKVHQTLGWVAEKQDRNADALGHAEQALALFRAAGDQAGQAAALNNVGWCHTLVGDYQQARAFCREAVAGFGELGDRNGEAASWDSLGFAEQHLGNLAEAARCYERAIGLARALGNRYAEAEWLTHLSDVQLSAENPPEAREALRLSLDILDELHHPDAEQVRARLAGLDGLSWRADPLA